MHLWPNPSIIRASKKWDVNNALANRPKGLTDEEWKAIVADHKLNKKIMLNTVPKESKKIIKQSDRK
jgi:hypothetical protein